MVAVDPRVLDLVATQRERIEGGLPPKRWRSQAEYLTLAIRLGAEQLSNVQPVVDPLADQWAAVEQLAGSSNG